MSEIEILTPLGAMEMQRVLEAEGPTTIRTISRPYGGFLERLLEAVHMAKHNRSGVRGSPGFNQIGTSTIGPSLSKSTNRAISEFLNKEPWDPHNVGWDPAWGAVGGMTKNMLSRFFKARLFVVRSLQEQDLGLLVSNG